MDYYNVLYGLERMAAKIAQLINGNEPKKKAPESAHLCNEVSFNFSSSKLKIIKVSLLWWLIVFAVGCLCGPVTAI